MAALPTTEKLSGDLSGTEIHVSGFPTRPASPHPLRAGPLSLCFDAGSLRWICRGQTEIVRGIYVAVRDESWGTVSGRSSDLQIRSDAESFHIAFRSEHVREEIDFDWRATIVGESDRTITFTMDGEARTTFQRNRIGFCVLHPADECARARCRVRHINGVIESLRFPGVIAAEQPVTGFHEVQALAHEVAPGVWVELLFEGEVFELEDQRNWIDASFKTYGTPLSLPRPVRIEAGTKIRQRVILRLIESPEELAARWLVPVDSATGVAAPSRPRREFHPNLHRGPNTGSDGDAVLVEVDFATCFQLPEVGLQAAAVVSRLSAEEFARHTARLGLLGLAHLRCDVHLAEANWRQIFSDAFREASAAGLPIELAIYLPTNLSEAASRLAELGKCLHDVPAPGMGGHVVKRLLVLQDGQMSTTRAALQMVRSQLDWLSAPTGAGTDADLYQFNLQRPPGEAADFVFWSMNPLVHVFDNASVAETPAGAAAQVRSVGEYFPGKPRCVTPVTFQPRFNPVAIKAKSPTIREDLPADLEVRPLSLFGAAWTLAMINALAEAGASSITLYKTTGARGVMESGPASLLAERLPSVAGGVFPMFHVLADLAEASQIGKTQSSHPANVAAMATVGERNQGCLLLANLNNSTTEVNLTLSRKIGQAQLRLLEGANVVEAMRQPEAWRQRPGVSWAATDRLKLSPHALARLDFQLPAHLP